VLFFIVGVIALVIAAVGGIIYLSPDSHSGGKSALLAASMAGKCFPLGFISLLAGAVCTGLSSIAKTALYKRAILEEQYRFIERGSEAENSNPAQAANETTSNATE
jgi:hypothetical protein